MGKVMIVGAGGRAGRAATTEAVRRGHAVTAVVRDPSRCDDLAGPGVTLVVGDVTDAAALATVAAGHDAVIAAVYDSSSTAPREFFLDTARALTAGLGSAGVTRLVWVGLASLLPTSDGTALMDTDGYPNEHRGFYLAHAAATDVFASAGSDLDWVAVSPAGDFDHGGTSAGGYAVAPADADSRITYADFALALLDEAETPRTSRTHVGVERTAS
ncbi:NAD(P)-dependent oxidoreductase [Mumia zhuanghuii]|uniref:NAD-dependent epimerase/dehydratase family protein n=1 Tax=Mumia zhuanghuii TaxID=2585211 RepID=A0A5C4MXL2_9ACTN|nr:NAD(P)H-binding protein [Mumia zhuanghuii]TNC41320.1 NAD-dependent epimerase/dehydratase family protein [Mumia zhuanghuii]TNC50897.1 NAD-dependent epimerase/dehydratase family protein [Mumia zhuanghuii]